METLQRPAVFIEVERDAQSTFHRNKERRNVEREVDKSAVWFKELPPHKHSISRKPLSASVQEFLTLTTTVLLVFNES